MYKFIKWTHLACAIIWTCIFIYALLTNNVDYKTLFICAAVVVITSHICDFIGEINESKVKGPNLKP